MEPGKLCVQVGSERNCRAEKTVVVPRFATQVPMNFHSSFVVYVVELSNTAVRREIVANAYGAEKTRKSRQYSRRSGNALARQNRVSALFATRYL